MPRRAAAIFAFIVAAVPIWPAPAAPIALQYRATWAGLPAADIVLRLEDEAASYRTRLDLRTVGVPRWLTRFAARAVSEGTWSAEGAAVPRRYEAVYDLRKRKDKCASLRFREQDGVLVAERGPEDTSSKPSPPEAIRRGAVDPLTALVAVRRRLASGTLGRSGGFAIPVFDGARRFDVEGAISPAHRPGDRLLQVRLVLRPIAGFDDRTSDQDEAVDERPREVEIAFTDDARLLPVRLSIPIGGFAALVSVERECTAERPCRFGQD